MFSFFEIRFQKARETRFDIVRKKFSSHRRGNLLLHIFLVSFCAPRRRFYYSSASSSHCRDKNLKFQSNFLQLKHFYPPAANYSIAKWAKFTNQQKVQRWCGEKFATRQPQLTAIQFIKLMTRKAFVLACFTLCCCCCVLFATDGVGGNWRKQLINHLLIWRIYKFGGGIHTPRGAGREKQAAGRANKVISELGVHCLLLIARLGLHSAARSTSAESETVIHYG